MTEQKRKQTRKKNFTVDGAREIENRENRKLKRKTAAADACSAAAVVVVQQEGACRLWLKCS